MLREDIKRVGLSTLQCMLLPGVRAIIVFRFGHWLLTQPRIVRCALYPVYFFLHCRITRNWGIDIARRAIIGPGLRVGHFGGIIISPLATIGRNLDLSHDVTIGISGHGERSGAPSIGDNVYIGPGAKLFGKITIGDNVKIGANAVIHKDIPANAIVVLKPGFEIISYESKRAQEVLK